MDLSEIKKLVNNILIEEFEKNESELNEDASLVDDLDLDSLDGIDLIVALEKAMKAKTGKEHKIEEEKAKKIQKIGDIYKTIDKLINQ